MRVETISRARFPGANTPAESRQHTSPEKLLTTGQVAQLTGLSESYFEKGRIYGYGPSFIRLRPKSRSGAIRYRPEDLRRWLAERECNPEEVCHD